jgi:signal peptidase I
MDGVAAIKLAVRRIAVAAIVLMAAIGVWAVSTQQMSYVITSGISMQPVYHANDLVIVMRSNSYEVGQIAAYHSHAGVKALHRIIGGDGERGYVLKGDNNQSIDVDKPTADKLIGRAVLHIPQGGTWLQPVLNPTGLGMLGFLIVGGGAAAPKTRRELRRRRRQKRATGMSSWVTAVTVAKTISRLHPALRALAVVAALLSVAGIALGVLGWMKPVTQTQVSTPGDHESMAFSYSANVGKTPAYDSTTVIAPDPIFRKVAPSVDLKLDYRGKPGRITVRARIAAGNGWQSVMQLAAPKRFTSSIYRTTMPLDLTAIDARAKAAAEAIGAAAGELTVIIKVHIQHDDGTEFMPELPLKVSDLQLLLAQGAESLVADATKATAGATVQPRQISAFGHDLLSAADARRHAVVMILAALAAMVFVALSALRKTPLQTRAQIQRRYPHLLVPVEPMASPPGKPVVMVDTFPALVKLAEKYGQMILTWTRPDGADDFVVRDEGILYRYRIDPDVTISPAAPSKPTPEPAPADQPRTAESPAGTTPVMGLPSVPELPPEAATDDAGSTAAGDEAAATENPPVKKTAPRKRATKTAATKTAAAKAAAKSTGTRAPAKRTRSAAKPPQPSEPMTEAPREPSTSATEIQPGNPTADTDVRPGFPAVETKQPGPETPDETPSAVAGQSETSDSSEPQLAGTTATNAATTVAATSDNQRIPSSTTADEEAAGTAAAAEPRDDPEKPGQTVTAVSGETGVETRTTSGHDEPAEPEQATIGSERPEEATTEPEPATAETHKQHAESVSSVDEANPAVDEPKPPEMTAGSKTDETAPLETDSGQADTELPTSDANRQHPPTPAAEPAPEAAPQPAVSEASEAALEPKVVQATEAAPDPEATHATEVATAAEERSQTPQSAKNQKHSNRRKSRSRRTPQPAADKPQTAPEPASRLASPTTSATAEARETMEDLAERNTAVATPEPGSKSDSEPKVEVKPVPWPEPSPRPLPDLPMHNPEPIYDFLPATKRHPVEIDDVDDPDA